MFLHLCVILFTGGESLSRGVSVRGVSMSRGFLPGGLYPGGLCPRAVYVEEASLSMGVSVNGEVSSSVHGGRGLGGLCPGGVSVQGVSLSRGLCTGIRILLECILVMCLLFYLQRQF